MRQDKKDFLKMLNDFGVKQETKFSKIQNLFVINRELEETGENQSQIISNKEQIWLFLYNYMITYYDGGTGGKDVGAIDYIMEKYDPSIGPLENFVNYTWSKRGMNTRKEKEEGISAPGIISINVPLGEEEDITIEETIHLPEEDDPTQNEGIFTQESIENIIEITSGINKLKKDDDDKKMVFTENITTICKLIDVDNPTLANREKDIMSGLNIKFLDFYMKEKCETLKKICITDLKAWGALLEEYGEIVAIKNIVQEKNREIEIELPLSNDIYKCFFLSVNLLKSANDSRISQIKANYQDFLKSLGLETIIKNGKSVNCNGQSGSDIIRNYMMHSPIGKIVLECLASYGDKIKGTGTELKATKLLRMINASMEEKCEEIQKCYSEIRDRKDLNEEYIMSYIKPFINEWRTRFDEKYNYYRTRTVKKYVTDDIKTVALREIEKAFSVDEEKMQVILKSLHIEFAERKLLTGITICDTIAQNTAAKIEHEIVDSIENKTKSDRRLIRDVIRYLKTSKAKDAGTIVKKIQNENIYNYFWA